MKPESGASAIRAGDHSIAPIPFREELVTWGRDNFRAFPWRFTNEPYRVLMAEIMLHRTQASQVVPVYERFMEAYPDAAALARASRDELLEAFSPLGLRWRAGLVHDMAAELRDNFGGQVPQREADLLSLPGISDYIAGAVRCFAFGLPVPIVDTNTIRIVGRLFGLEIRDSSRRNRLFKDLIAALVDPARPRDYNLALLDLGALVCTKVKPPRCWECPVQRHCRYGIDPSTNKRAGP